MISANQRLSAKNQEIFQSLVEIAVGLGPEAKLPTVQQLRRDFGVSVATLDGVLSHLESQNVIYRRQGSGIYVSPYLHKKNVGLVIVPEYFRAGTSPFWAEIVEDMRQRASLQGEVFRFYLGLPSGRSDVPVHEDLQDDIASQRLDGVFFIGHNSDAISWLESRQVPVVNFAGSAQYKVGLDYQDLIEQSVNTLVESGCQNIGLMVPFLYRDEDTLIKPSSHTIEFEKLLIEKGLSFNPSFVWDAKNIGGLELLTYQEQGHAAALRFFDSNAPARPDGIVIVDDMMTRGALIAMQKLGVSLTQDVKIASHTNRGSSVLQGYDELLLLEINPADIVKAMFEMLNTLMDGEVPSHPTALIKANLKSV